ncbi:PREDICTED: cytochrome P450 307a1-like [Dufourea novaeangliae]|uniref:cytochrome P450 307a1-like n=1 Tax=Dufourea novaeangliae TaxID=178035 RepID=UPI00076749A3|nr:PREDICTED: cytochrome P450 307a1-like [Dufourea novaeangliae]
MIPLTATTCFLIAVTFVALAVILLDHLRSKKTSKEIILDGEKDSLPEPPGPKPWPILGSLHILGRYDVPYKAFADLVRDFDCQVIKLRMGSTPCAVVNGLENIREVLTTKGHHFDSRPNFVRYHLLFGGNKENSLAFCNWSDVQKGRREMLRAHTFPRAFSARYNELNKIIGAEMDNLVGYLDSMAGKSVHVKPLILHSCANIFITYLCSKKFHLEHAGFRNMVENFDKVFYEVNQGYAADFLPFLMPLHQRNIARMAHWSHEIRKFILDNIINERVDSWNGLVMPERDYLDCLVNHVKTDAEPYMSWNTALFVIEDIIGGHSAIGNLLVKVLGFIATRPDVQRMAHEEIDSLKIAGNYVGLENRGSLPYVEAIILESIRVIASPIVPHVANQDSSIAGYRIKKDTFIFLNNYELNMSTELWTSPEEFMPDRFVQNGRLLKPEHFLPFGGGRRSCMGYKLVQYVTFAVLATLLKNYKIVPMEKENYTIPIGNLALPERTYSVRFERR